MLNRGGGVEESGKRASRSGRLREARQPKPGRPAEVVAGATCSLCVLRVPTCVWAGVPSSGGPSLSTDARCAIGGHAGGGEGAGGGVDDPLALSLPALHQNAIAASPQGKVILTPQGRCFPIWQFCALRSSSPAVVGPLSRVQQVYAHRVLDRLQCTLTYPITDPPSKPPGLAVHTAAYLGTPWFHPL